jgi:hypothetical protein
MDGTAVTIDTPLVANFRGLDYYILEIAEYDNTSWNAAAAVTDSQTTGSTMVSPTVGTLTGDEIALFIGITEDGNVLTGADTGSTEIQKFVNDLDIRDSIVGYSTTDDTPGFAYTGNGDAGIIAVRISDGTDGTHAGGGGGGSNTPQGIHGLDKGFNPITATRLGGVLE